MERDFFRAHRLEAAYAIFGLLIFAIFLFSSFPYQDALSGVLAPMGLRFSSRDQGFSFPYGVSMDGVMLSDAKSAGRPVFESDRVRLTPALLPLLLGSPGVHVRADAYGGALSLTASRSGDGTVLRFSASDVHLERYQALRMLGLNLGGSLSGDGRAYVSPRDLAADSGVLRLSAAQASFRLAPGMPPLKVGDLTAVLNLDGGKLNIQELESHGGDLSLSGRGVIELEPDASQSALAIRFELKTTPAARARLGFLLNFLPHPPNSTPYFLHGTLGAPSLS